MAEPASMNNISRTSNFLFMLYLFSFSFRRLRWLAGLRAPQALRLLFLIDPSPAHLSPASSTPSVLAPSPLPKSQLTFRTNVVLKYGELQGLAQLPRRPLLELPRFGRHVSVTR